MHYHLADTETGRNLFTAGLEYERLHVKNLFIQDTNGIATYASLDAFRNQTPMSIGYSNSVTLTFGLTLTTRLLPIAAPAGSAPRTSAREVRSCSMHGRMWRRRSSPVGTPLGDAHRR